MARKVNKKCQHCATLSAEEAIALHGIDGDHCWNPDDIRQLGYNCHRRRNHYRNREDDNRNRRRMRKLASHPAGMGKAHANTVLAGEEMQLIIPPPPIILAAVLVLYRNHKDAPVHAVAAEIWQGDRKVGEMKPIHCMGMRGDQVATYLQQVLTTLRESYGVSRFEDVVKEIPVQQCPIEACPISSL